MNLKDTVEGCSLGISFGRESLLYSFPHHPMNTARLELFTDRIRKLKERAQSNIKFFEPAACSESDLERFHTKGHIDHVKRTSAEGKGHLGSEDTPGFKGVFEASVFAVGSTLHGLRLIMDGKLDHYFNPVGGLHHAFPQEARGFCVFNDPAIAISMALDEYDLRRVAYVDIDAHHGDGVYYGFVQSPRVIIGDIHEDGRYLYPGTGTEDERGTGVARGTKLNLGLLPGDGDSQFIEAFDRVEEFVAASRPEMIFFQCGADGLSNDPIADLGYTSAAHRYASKKLHALAHGICHGRILAMGGGGYDPTNVSDAWGAVIEELAGYG